MYAMYRVKNRVKCSPKGIGSIGLDWRNALRGAEHVQSIIRGAIGQGCDALRLMAGVVRAMKLL